VQNVFVPYDDMDEKLIAAAGAQAGPDVAVVNGGDTTQIAEGGALLPMNDYWSSYTDRKEFPESVLHTYGSKIYSVQGYVNLLGLWYNADLLSRLKVDVPTTFGEFTSAMEQVLKASSSTIPLTLCGLPNSQGEWQAYPWLTGYGFDYKSPSTSALTKGFSLISDWVNAGYVSREAVTYDQTIPFTRFLVGNVAFSENGNWQLATAKAGAKFRYGIAPLPSGPDGSQIYLGGEGVGIGRYSKNPDLAWAYLKTTYLSKTGQLIPLQDVGSIPSRLDVGDNPEIKNNKLLKPFAAELAKRGAAYPPLIYPASIVNQELVVGQQWSAVIGGASPSAAARTAITGIEAARRKG
jgi:multiple sugar transport system substrate-binding protein